MQAWPFKTISMERGFLSDFTPLHFLPSNSKLNDRLNIIAANLPELLKTQTLRAEADSLDHDLSFANITVNKADHREADTAILILLFIAQGYVWENFTSPAGTIPAVIGRNLYALCKEQQRFPALTYADYVLRNWKLVVPDRGITLENIEPLFTLTGTRDEAWFIKIHVMIEAVCGKAAHAAFQIADAAKFSGCGTEETRVYIRRHLADISHALRESIQLLQRMQEGCQPYVYWSLIRNYLHGWEKAGDQKGVKFNGVSIRNRDTLFRFKGPSGAQSSIIPTLDTALGIQHEIDEMYQTMLTFRQYMPAEHGSFIELLKLSSPGRHLADSSHELKEAWHEAVRQLGLFRMEHIRMVKQYIYNPAEYHGLDKMKITGTGGTAIDDYLGGRQEACEMDT